MAVISRLRRRDAGDAAMVTINLLPWRELAKRYEEKQIKKIVSMILIMTTLLGMTTHHMLSNKCSQLSNQLEQIKEKWQMAQQKIMPNNEEEKENQLAEKIITTQSATNLLFTTLLALPKQFCLTEIKREQNHLSMRGLAYSVLDVMNLMQYAQDKKIISAIYLEDIHQEEHGWRFHLQAKQENVLL